ncbi:hypothetical protein CLAFUW4_14166 [Fulvia fulva]|nr:hypothetical protein CLAFUR4_14169 [Fulvia fulva]WPV22286.1 hypothetical protein CLAFUW4_14166 [Fulvia fulva]WPV37163.1 hypothetical protein CLAFUW7_14177 [Fulvia fulva]
MDAAIMSKLYSVKASLGKGDGVFARKPLTQGTIVMVDNAVMLVPKRSVSVSEQDSEAAFDKLSQRDQKIFLQLHEGTRAYSSKPTPDENASLICLNVSKINHSCRPNAESIDGTNAYSMRIRAIKTIEEDEEIFINYQPMVSMSTRARRQKWLELYYGLKCDCVACSASAQDVTLSDARRQIISALTLNIQGHQAPDFSVFDQITSETAEDSSILRGIPMLPLRERLSLEAYTAHNFLLAKFLEAEGLEGPAVAQNVECWMMKAIEITEKVCGIGSSEARECRLDWQNMQCAIEMNTAMQFLKQKPALIRQLSIKKDRARLERLIHSVALKYTSTGKGQPALINITEQERKGFLQEQATDLQVKAQAEKIKQMYFEMCEHPRR